MYLIPPPQRSIKEVLVMSSKKAQSVQTYL